MKELFIREPASKYARACNAVTLAIAVLFLLVFAGCAPDKKADVDKSKPWAEARLTIGKSAQYAPTFAVWVKDEASGDSATLYVTGKAGKEQLKSRPGALPVWSGMQADEAREAIDAVTAATPAGTDAVITVQLPDQFVGKKLAFFVEANVSFDYNDFYKEGLKSGEAGYSDVNGQPSIIYTASADTAANPAGALVLAPAGHGDVLGATAATDTDMANITTAEGIFSSIQIQYNLAGK